MQESKCESMVIICIPTKRV